MTENSSPPALRARLRRANTPQLLDLIERHGRTFAIQEVRQILLNPFTTREVIEELLIFRHLTSTYEVQRALCRHRLTPQVAAMRFLPMLFWRDLMEISLDLRITSAVRRSAERNLLQRLPRLSVGEKIALARRASPIMIPSLCQEEDPRVIQALLENGRLTELSLLPLLSSKKTHPKILQVVAEHPRWGPPYALKKALAKNPLTPFQILFRILPTLRREDLVDIAGQESHSSIVRQRCQDLLAERPEAPNSEEGSGKYRLPLQIELEQS